MQMAIAAWHALGALRLVEQNKLLFIETKDIVETTLALTNFKRACDSGRGAVFFSIARGKVAEGIDFDRHYGRAVVRSAGAPPATPSRRKRGSICPPTMRI
jgi:DNA excision repair protein ERCC-2